MPGNPTSLFVNALLSKSKYPVVFSVYGDACDPAPLTCCGTIGRKSIKSLNSSLSKDGIIL